MAAPSAESLVADVPLEHKPQRRMAAVVLNHRTAEDTYVAASSLMASNRRPDHLIVVDNDVADECRAHFLQPQTPNSEPKAQSPGPSVSPCLCGPASCPKPKAQSPEPRAQSPQVTYLHTGRNLGFSGGMNVGIRTALAAGADLVLLVNSDIVVSPECLERLESMLGSHAGAGIAGPLVCSRAQPDRVASAGISYNRTTGRMRVLGVGTPAKGHGSALPDVDAVSGCLMLVTRRVFETIGLLDERYFFGFEDLDFCLRARRAGCSTLLAAGAVAYHEGGRSIGQASSRRWYFGARNHLLVASQSGPGEGGATRTLRLCFVAALSIAHAVTADAGSLGARLAATARGVRDHLSGRYGPDPAA